MLEINPWLFLLLVFSATAAYVFAFLYTAHWLMHKRPKKPSPMPQPPSKIILP